MCKATAHIIPHQITENRRYSDFITLLYKSFPLCNEDATSDNYFQLTPQGENDSHTAIEIILDQVEPTIVSDGEENDLRPSSPQPSNPPYTSPRLRHIPAVIVQNYVWRNWWEVSSQPLLYDRSPSEIAYRTTMMNWMGKCFSWDELLGC